MKSSTLILAVLLLIHPLTAKDVSPGFELFFRVLGVPAESINAEDFDPEIELEKLFPDQISYEDASARLGIAARRLAFGSIVLTSRDSGHSMREETTKDLEDDSHVLEASIIIEDDDYPTRYSLKLWFDCDGTLFGRGVTFGSEGIKHIKATTKQLKWTKESYEALMIPEPKYNQ